jgi:hypothetical protein
VSLLWYFFNLSRGLYLLTVLIEVLTPAFESTAGLEDSFEIALVTF